MLELKRAELDVAEVKDFMRHIIKNNRLLQAKGKIPLSVEICGPAGLGKTSIANQLGEELGLDVVCLSLTQLGELGDLVGYPLRQFEMSKTKEKRTIKDTDPTMPARTIIVPLKEPLIEWVDEVALDQYKAEGFTLTGKNRTIDCPPQWIAGKTKGILLVLDDYTRASQLFIQATMELISRQEYVSWKLPPDSHIILTTNPSDGEYTVNELDVAQRTRFIGVNLKWNAERWAEWAERMDVDSRAINFVLQSPEIVEKEVNPRSLTMFFDAISSIPDFNEKNALGLVQMIGEGCVGVTTSTMFTAFINNRMDKMISPKAMFETQDLDEVITKLKSSIHPKGENYRSDIASILSMRLLNYSLMLGEKKKVTDFIIKRLIALITNEQIFTNDIAYVVAKKLIAGDKTSFQSILVDRNVQTMVTK